MSEAAPTPAGGAVSPGDPFVLLEARDLRARYDESPILRGIDLQVPENSVVALLGRNGVGKTTLLKTLMGLVPKAEGDLLFEGRPIGNLRPEERARLGFGYVPQGREIFPNLTVWENLQVSLSVAGPAGRERLEQVYTLFPVIQEMLGRKGGVLSGGQQQQLAIGRALLTAPRLLLLDEPTEGIQPSIIDQIEDAVHSLKREGDLSIILVEQYLDFARSASDTYAILDRGSVVHAGQSEELSEEVIQHYLTV